MGSTSDNRRIVDLRSDTITTPTDDMREAMRHARVGDDAYGEDPTVAELQHVAAERLGKEASLFVPSGIMGNAVCVVTHTERSGAIVAEAISHIGYIERQTHEQLSGVQIVTIDGHEGLFGPEELDRTLAKAESDGIDVRLVCLENTHNLSGGTVTDVDTMRALCEVAHRRGVPVHLDGARVLNAAVALGVDVRELVAECDSVLMCLSKGLAAPVGSMIAGSAEFIARARKVRHLFGGQLRQVGVLAAAGLVALRKMVDRLADDHENAGLLARALAQMPGVRIDVERIRTNIVVFWVEPPERADALIEKAEELGVKIRHLGGGRIRAVTHKDVRREDVLYAIDAIAEALKSV